MSDAATPRSPTRRLSAIVFCDMVGYTALMQEDELRALLGRDRQRESLESRIPQYRGRLLQYYGDGALSVFDSAIDAVAAGVAIQRDLRQAPEVPVRIGIHTGDVVYDEDGVFGDGVNIASRVQSLGSPGSVLITEKVYDEIKNQPQFPVVPLGEFDLKNVKRPVAVYAIASPGVGLPPKDTLPAKARDARRSLAVLPFANMSSDPENEFFSDGITEELINALTRVNGLQVTARTSSFAFKGRHEDVRTIAGQLGVDTILEGSVRRARDRVRITAQLIDASNGYHLFSETYDRDLSDIFQTQDEIAQAIMQSVQGTLAPQAKTALVTARTNEEAHKLYLQGMREYNAWTPESVRRAIEFYRLAITRDESFAPAWSGIAHAQVFLGMLGQAPPSVSMPEAERHAIRALELDPMNGEAHVALGFVRYSYDWDFEAAYAAFQKALGVAPGSATAHGSYGFYLSALGDHDAAIEQMDIALELDPLSPVAMMSRGSVLMHAGRSAEARAQFERLLAMDPGFRAAIEGLGVSYLIEERFEEAATTLERIVEITGDEYKSLSSRGYAWAKLGRHEDARRALEMLRERARRNPHLVLDIDFVIIHAGLGEYDEAVRYLELAAQKRLGEVVHVANAEIWRLLVDHPAGLQALDRLGLSWLIKPRPPAP